MGLRSAAPPPGGGVWYTQEGTTIQQWDGNGGLSGLTSLQERVRLVTSPYSTAYELNGLSDTGDWYQVVVAYNWPGCSGGFEEVTEVWNNLQSSGPVTCDPTVALSAGDLIEFGLGFDASHNACLKLNDLSTGSSQSTCQAQPDLGATQFIVLSSQADSNGYYTGPMTETVNTTSSTCPWYTKLPTAAYLYTGSEWVSGYIPWSDEFEFGGTAGACYSYSPGLETVGSGDPMTYYFDTAASTGFGPRWAGAQNNSVVSPGTTFRYETDPTLLTGVSLSPSNPTPSNGEAVTINASVAGGVGPYSALWYLNGSLQSPRTSTFAWLAGAPASYTFTAYGVDHQGDVVGPSAALVLTVPGALSVSTITAFPGSGKSDVGQLVTFSVAAIGGIGPKTFDWTGLPAGCASANRSTLPCTPSGAGLSSVVVSVADSNHTTVTSAPLGYTVSTAPVATLTVQGLPVDVGLTLTLRVSTVGGALPLQIHWSGLPAGCVGTGSAFLCVPTSAGSGSVAVVVTDSNGVSSSPNPVLVRVSPALLVSLSGSRLVADAGQTVVFRATVAGGSGGDAFTWAGVPTGCGAPNASSLTCVLTNPGSIALSVSVTDLSGANANSSLVLVIVYPALVVQVTGRPAHVAPGDPLNFTAVVGGGAGDLTYTWSGLPPGCSGSDGPWVSCVPNLVGSYTANVTVTDASGAKSSAQFAVSVATPGTPPFSVLGLGPTASALLLLIPILLTVGGILAWRRRYPPPKPGLDPANWGEP